MTDPTGMDLLKAMDDHWQARAESLESEADELEAKAHAKRIEAAQYRSHGRLLARHRGEP